MLSEHEQGRAEIAGMRAALALCEAGAAVAVADFALRARRYALLLREHIAKENDVLFPMADGMLDERDQEDLLERFESIEHLDLGEGAHERYLALARRLAERLGVKRSESPASLTGACCGHHRPRG